MEKKQPAYVIPLGKPRIEVAIWENESEEHGKWFNVSVSRSYRSGDQWKETKSLGRDDLPIVRAALDQAYVWILKKEKGSSMGNNRRTATAAVASRR